MEQGDDIGAAMAGADEPAASTPPPFRLAVLNTHPIQYFSPLYRYINARPDIDVTALFLSDFSLKGGHDPEFGVAFQWDVDLTSGFAHEFVPGRGAHSFPHGFWTYVCPALFGIIRRDRFDALWLHGHGFAANLLAMVIARLRGIPVFMRGETHDGAHAGWLKRRVRSLLMRMVYAQCAQMLAIGSRNADYYRSLGIGDHRIAMVPYTVDNERFAREAAEARDSGAASALRQHHGIAADVPVVLFASKLTERKRAQDLVAAMALLEARGIGGHLLIVGSGEHEPAVRARVAETGLKAVSFAGFVNQAGLPACFAASDIFVLPSDNENWGLIVNEVMAAGLPVVVTDEVGCAVDIVRPGDNGAIVPVGDVEALAAALEPMLADAAYRARLAQGARRIIGGWSYAQCLEGVRLAIARVRAART